MEGCVDTICYLSELKYGADYLYVRKILTF